MTMPTWWLCTTCRLQYPSAEMHCDTDWLSPSKKKKKKWPASERKSTWRLFRTSPDSWPAIIWQKNSSSNSLILFPLACFSQATWQILTDATAAHKSRTGTDSGTHQTTSNCRREDILVFYSKGSTLTNKKSKKNAKKLTVLQSPEAEL